MMSTQKWLRRASNCLCSLFPPQCLHCLETHTALGSPLCKLCVSLMEVREAESILISFSRFSPAASLMRQFKKRGDLPTGKLLAAYMAFHYARSSFSLPDLITAVPSTRFRKWQTSGGTAELLAEELGKILQRPAIRCLKRVRQLLRQDTLEREERLKLSSDDFALRHKVNIRGKHILLIDDTITTGSTLQATAEHLWQASALQVTKMACLDLGYLRD